MYYINLKHVVNIVFPILATLAFNQVTSINTKVNNYRMPLKLLNLITMRKLRNLLWQLITPNDHQPQAHLFYIECH